MSKRYLATEATHERIADALEKLVVKGSNGSVLVDPYDFASELLWINGTTNSGTKILKSSNNNQFEYSVYNTSTNTFDTTIPLTDMIKKPIILRIPMPKYIANENWQASFVFAPNGRYVSRALIQNQSVSASHDVSIYLRSYNSEYSIALNYLPGWHYSSDYTYNATGFQITSRQLVKITQNKISSGELTPFETALVANNNEIDVYINPQKHIMQIYWGGQIDKEHCLKTSYLPAAVYYRLYENDGVWYEEGFRMILEQIVNISGTKTWVDLPGLNNGFVTSSESGNVIIPTTLFDDGVTLLDFFSPNGMEILL